MKQKIAIAITGASGSIYAQTLLNSIINKQPNCEIALVFSSNAKDVWKHELQNESYLNLPFKVYGSNDFYSPIASGSSGFQTLIICPCSMGTLGRIASGISNDLITRAADVMLKERRKLILVTRETPLNLIHIKNMEAVTLAGGIICPATPSFYSIPKTIEDLAKTVTDRVLSLAGISEPDYKWGEN